MLAKARMSIVLATDSFATIEPVIRCLRKQTRSHELEVALATPDPEAMRAAVRRTRQSQALPPRTLLAVVLGWVLRSGGEALGYAGLLGQYLARRMHSYELHKLKYARSVSV